MDSKKIIWLLMSVGLVLGSFLPMLWGESELSMSSVIFSAIGGFLGIWIGYKISL